MSADDYELPGYQLGEEIARTDRAIVYSAIHNASGEAVAVKLVPNDRAGVHEVEMLRRMLTHCPQTPAHVVHLLDTHRNGNELWIVLEYFESTLQRLHAGEMTALALMSVGLDSAKGQLEMFLAGIVDDDVKPGNIAFKMRSGRAAHIDLEFARLIGSPPTGYTPDYAAPEVEKKIPSNTSPCYGWARTMEELTVGRFDLGPDDLLSDYVPWVGVGFARLVAQCCNPDHRCRPSVSELHQRMKQEVLGKRRCPRCNAVMFRDAPCRCCT